VGHILENVSTTPDDMKRILWFSKVGVLDKGTVNEKKTPFNLKVQRITVSVFEFTV